MVVKKRKIKMVSSLDVSAAIKNPSSFPWNYEDKSISEITVSNVIEFIPGKLRGKFMDELYRILADDGKVTITVPYYTSWIAVHDWRYEFPLFNEQSFLVCNSEWRKANNKPEMKCDFDFTYGYALEPEVEARNDETKSFHVKNYNNTVKFLTLVFNKRNVRS